MKLKKFEKCIIALTLALVSFCFGYFAGSGSRSSIIYAGTERINVETSKIPGNHYYSSQTTSAGNVYSTEDKMLDKPASEDFVVNVNECTTEDLLTLPGIGEVLAERIIEYRKVNGNFSAPEDILEVNGIGAERYAAIKDIIAVN